MLRWHSTLFFQLLQAVLSHIGPELSRSWVCKAPISCMASASWRFQVTTDPTRTSCVGLRPLWQCHRLFRGRWLCGGRQSSLSCRFGRRGWCCSSGRLDGRTIDHIIDLVIARIVGIPVRLLAHIMYQEIPRDLCFTHLIHLIIHLLAIGLA